MKIYHFLKQMYHNYFNLRNWLKWDQQKGQKITHINEIQAIWTGNYLLLKNLYEKLKNVIQN